MEVVLLGWRRVESTRHKAVDRLSQFPRMQQLPSGYRDCVGQKSGLDAPACKVVFIAPSIKGGMYPIPDGCHEIQAQTTRTETEVQVVGRGCRWWLDSHWAL